jgi:hypothetical protein
MDFPYRPPRETAIVPLIAALLFFVGGAILLLGR